jgi:hypothetical protein
MSIETWARCNTAADPHHAQVSHADVLVLTTRDHAPVRIAWPCRALRRPRDKRAAKNRTFSDILGHCQGQSTAIVCILGHASSSACRVSPSSFVKEHVNNHRVGRAQVRRLARTDSSRLREKR